jgi:hypothetical protein
MKAMGRPLALFVLAALGCGGSAATMDASADRAATDGGADTGGDGAGGVDASGSCHPGAVMFPQGGTLAPGTLCDEVYACADDAAGAARIEAASPRFSCAPGAEPQSACAAYTCAYRNPGGPSTLDEAELADICALTVLAPSPPLRCVVFVNAP